jgi:hypothetical protein
MTEVPELEPKSLEGMAMQLRYAHTENSCSCYAWKMKIWEELIMSTFLQMLHSVWQGYQELQITNYTFSYLFLCIIPTTVTLKWVGHVA